METCNIKKSKAAMDLIIMTFKNVCMKDLFVVRDNHMSFISGEVGSTAVLERKKQPWGFEILRSWVLTHDGKCVKIDEI